MDTLLENRWGLVMIGSLAVAVMLGCSAYYLADDETVKPRAQKAWRAIEVVLWLASAELVAVFLMLDSHEGIIELFGREEIFSPLAADVAIIGVGFGYGLLTLGVLEFTAKKCRESLESWLRAENARRLAEEQAWSRPTNVVDFTPRTSEETHTVIDIADIMAVYQRSIPYFAELERSGATGLLVYGEAVPAKK